MKTSAVEHNGEVQCRKRCINIVVSHAKPDKDNIPEFLAGCFFFVFDSKERESIQESEFSVSTALAGQSSRSFR